MCTMLMTITTIHSPATDLGFLLHKTPGRVHDFELSFGRAHVFYPEATEARCTVCLLLDVDPIGIVRRQSGLPAPPESSISTSMIAPTSPRPFCRWRWQRFSARP